MAGRLESFAETVGRAGSAFFKGLREGAPASADDPLAGNDVLRKMVQDAQASNSQQAVAPRSVFMDPMRVMQSIGYLDRIVGCPYAQIKEIVDQSPAIAVIIMTRVNQVMQFGRPSEDTGGLGFEIVTRNPKMKMDRQLEREARRIRRFIEHTGRPQEPHLRDSFIDYLGKIARDTLKYAQDNTELVYDRLGRIAEFFAVDASTMRFSKDYKPYKVDDINKDVRYVQVMDGRVVTEYRQRDMIFGIRNASTDIEHQGYGLSELEQVLRACSNILMAFDYNSRVFSQGTNVRGIINTPGITEGQFQQFRQQVYEFMRGNQNAHTLPMVNSPDPLQYVDLTRSSKDMEYSAWWQTLLRLICAAYCIDPSEICYDMAPAGQSSTLQQPSNRDKIITSQERGLVPLLKYIEANLTTHVIAPMNRHLKLRFAGLDTETPEEKEALIGQQVRNIMTVNEVRAKQELKPFPPELGDIILDGGFLSNKAAVEAAAQQAALGQAAGDDGGQGFVPGDAPPGSGGDQEVAKARHLQKTRKAREALARARIDVQGKEAALTWILEP